MFFGTRFRHSTPRVRLNQPRALFQSVRGPGQTSLSKSCDETPHSAHISSQPLKRTWLACFVVFVMQEFEKCLKENGSYGGLSEETIKDASTRAHVSTNEQLHATAFDDTLSGTTAITLLLKVCY